MDGGAWWAAVYGVAQSRTQLKRLSSSSRAIPGLPRTQTEEGSSGYYSFSHFLSSFPSFPYLLPSWKIIIIYF